MVQVNPLDMLVAACEAVDASSSSEPLHTPPPDLGRGAKHLLQHVWEISLVDPDPDPDWIRTTSCSITSLVDPDPDPDPVASLDPDRSGSRRGKNDPENLKKVKKFHLLTCWMSSFEG
jgi:hypothetical protein